MSPTMSRRGVLLGSAATTLASVLARRGRAEQAGDRGDRKGLGVAPVQEFELRSSKEYGDPFWDVEVDVVVTSPGGSRQRIPAFWRGASNWGWRYSARQAGTYRYRVVCSDEANSDLHGVAGEFRVEAYRGDNHLLRGGALRVSQSHRYFESADGTPFFWLGDTWWMGLTERLAWPDDFAELVADRRAKGFNVVQLVAGLYPDMDSFDPRGRNEAGFPWEADYRTINPAWWDLADQRVGRLVEAELMPCIVGCWGYYLQKIGMQRMRAHWRTVIARWGALPVVWCLAGEGSMPWYLSDKKAKDRSELEQGWTEMARYVRAIDPFKRLITIHPSRSSRETVRDTSVLDFDMLQTGHGDYRSMASTVQQVVSAVDREPTMPVIESEVCYEGIMESCRQDIQRFMFWTTVLNGCCGFTYGANGIWQVNRPGAPYGPSPHGRTWGNVTWREAMQYPGGRQVGVGARLWRTLPWHEMRPHPEWVEPHWSKRDYHQPSAAGIPKRVRVIYTPVRWNPPRIRQLEPGVAYQVRLVNPSTGEETPRGVVRGDSSGDCRLAHFPQQRDWIIILESTS